MVTDSTIPSGHVVAFPHPTWGHTKPTISLLAKIVRYRAVHATLFIAVSMADRALKEVNSQFLLGAEDDIRGLIRIINIEGGPNPIETSLLTANFVNEYKGLLGYTQSSLYGEMPGSNLKPGLPQLIIIDLFLYDALIGIRGISGSSIPVYVLQTASVAATLFILGPEEMGGIGDLDEKLETIAPTDPKTKDQEADKLIHRLDGQLIEIPGLPPMYDHEHTPQKSILPPGVAFFFAKISKLFKECDGIIMNSTYLFEGKSLEAFKEWFRERPVISPGPSDFSLIARQSDKSPVGMEVEAFLDSAMRKYGPASVIYFSFGSAFWPLEPEKYWAVLDVMIEHKIPFIIAYASPMAKIPDEIKDKIEASGLGFLSNWLPQTAILSHEACGWFVTHCGNNSVTEAFSAGIPMICWPFGADQPSNSTNITAVHNMGYELFEVRTGPGLRKIHRLGDRVPEGSIEAVKREFTEVLKMARGEDGKIKRANVRKLREGIARQWAPGGENWQEIKKITDLLQVK